MKRMYMVLAAFLMTAMAFSQETITGTILDGETSDPLPGASIVVKGTTKGATTDFDGKFTLSVTDGSGTLVISYLGYVTKSVAFKSAGSIGSVTLEPDAQQLGEVVVVGSGVIDLAEDRQTPIAVTTVTAADIEQKTGNFDLPEVLKSTPSVQNVKGGGFGDGQMYLRGFDQTNTAFLLNGQPINGVEDGKMYWSNWTGVLDIANAVQVQRGLGSSKLAISSVGGTVNIVTKTVDLKEGGFVKSMVGNDDYLKTSAYYSTGLMENGWAFSALLGHWQGDGYMQGAKGQGQTYFLSAGYKLNDNHIFNFLITGAPQWHGSAGGASISDYLDKGRRYNDWWGYYKGEEYAGGRNYYHKPILNLSWDWKISEDSNLSTVAYASFGRGGFAYPEGRSFYSFRDANDLIDYDAIEANNLANPDADNYVKSSINSHNWFGLVANYEKDFNENLSFNVGVDARSYNGIHFRTAADLMGATPTYTSGYSGTYNLTKSLGYNPWSNTFKLTDTDHTDRFSYDYEEVINYIGMFTQLEYATDNYSVYAQGAVSSQSHVKTDYWNYATSEEAEKITNPGFNAKLGGSYNLNEDNIVYANAGYYSRQPFHDDLFTNIRSSNELNPFGDENQKITGLELGYNFKSEFISVNANVYHTIWDNRILSSADDIDGDSVSDEFTQSSGIKEIHQGVELEVFTRPVRGLKVNGFVSIGNWYYDGNVETRTYDINDVLLSSGDIAYVNDAKVGNAAQITAGANAFWNIAGGFSADASFNYYDNLYANIDLTSTEFETQDNRGSLLLPSYTNVDLGGTYKMFVGKEKDKSLAFRLNINNLFDEFYIENSSTSNYAEAGDDTWKGVNTSNRVDLGYGLTWNFSIRYNF
ncbi:carboxypeptidase-like regulatory domain-containing protein [Maribacter polysiphoniae]|uniref:Carboxypeptidase-like regulatory domain-containing protein n=1 Tax=Maribacter polysiphoniae TaxID=429344 RepID=A0A316E7W0_9FLAO|nr:TonB-dependent receptor [Maribacter polysiphoniae]MBD1260276.1 carboxypeptidase-like regulatory domain-containing protein [Maribacter polysiphoniae]PWK25738.1 outer membrane receptor protein involved in Fe transport [Maribacter polysiphoniae]